MKKFIVIFALMLITFVGKAQYINPNIRQDNTTPAQWNEWKGLMSLGSMMMKNTITMMMKMNIKK